MRVGTTLRGRYELVFVNNGYASGDGPAPTDFFSLGGVHSFDLNGVYFIGRDAGGPINLLSVDASVEERGGRRNNPSEAN